MERGHSRHHSAHYAPPTTSPRAAHQPSSRLYYDPSNPSVFHGDSFHHHDRKPFPPRSSFSKDGQMNGTREWHSAQQGIPPPPAPLSAAPSNIPPPNFFVAPQPPASNVVASAMSLPYDPSRRRSIGAAASPPHFAAGPAESPSMPAFAPRSMMPPSPSQPPPSAAHGAHGPPTTSPFAGIRDLATFSSGRRSGAGMSISSILGGAVDEPKPQQKSMQPPSPGRARASSMREYSNGYRERSPPRRDQGIFGQRPADGSAAFEQPAPSFRAFPSHEGYSANGSIPGRPSSQPTEQRPPNLVSETNRSEEGQINMFRSFPSTADRYGKERPVDALPVAQQIDRSAFSSPGANKELRDVFSPAYPTKQFATPMREDQTPLFRPAYPQPLMTAHESVEVIRGEAERATPQPYPTYRNGYSERPLTYEEHQRLEGARELQRKDSDPRSIFNISPELRRRGRDSPLPQAVQGAQPRHIGPGGDHPSIKSEFGRMFSGLGGGFGSATPVAGQSMNGNGTPSRIVSPTRPGEAGDYGRTFDEDEPRSASARPSRKSGGRRPREDELERYDGRMTPSLSQRGNKRAKTGHPHHHHHHHHNTIHHHHHDGPEQPGYGMFRFPSTPLATSTLKHHHHHGSHAHPPHHHHHQVAQSSMPPLKKPAVTIRSDSVVELVAKKPRKHLGSMPYNAHTSKPAVSGRHLHYSTTPDLIPKFEGKENCTYTVRVPRWYISRTTTEIKAGELSRLEEICRERRVWGSDIYTDDSDVVAAAVHSGWIRGDFGFSNDDLSALEEETQHESETLSLSTKPAQPSSVPAGYDMHVTLLILPPLEEYASTHRHHIWSRDWKGAELHDGMSYMIHKLEFVDEGTANRGVSRDASHRKARIAMEERRRREAAAALLMLPGIDTGLNGGIRVGA